MAEPRDYRYDIDGQTLDNMARYINQGAEN
jgi:hypothetical protein